MVIYEPNLAKLQKFGKDMLNSCLSIVQNLAKRYSNHSAKLPKIFKKDLSGAREVDQKFHIHNPDK